MDKCGFKLTIIIFFTLSIPQYANCIESYDPLCGPESLLIVCKHFGKLSTLKELCNLTDFDEKSGTTMHGLYNAALEKGLPAVPVKIDLEQLCSFKNPSIAFVDGNHFLIVNGCEKTK